MKKTICFIALLLVILIIPTCITGCGSDSKAGKSKEKSETHALKIEDIEWNVNEGIVDGERFVLLDYTNNSKYTLVGFELQFRQKDKITDEEKAKFFEDIKERFDINENDPDDMEDFKELKKREISMHAESERVAKIGETVSAINCKYYAGYYDVKDIEHYSLVTPDIAIIKYIDDSKVLTLYYDFSSKKYSADSKSEVSFYWTDKGLENAVPKPEAEYVKEGGRDDSNCFMFETYGWTLDDFNFYIKQCKDIGFTVDAKEHKGFYSADDSNGYNIYMYYDEDDFSMHTTVKTKTEAE